MTKLLLLLLTFLTLTAMGQVQIPEKLPFNPGEKLTYIASYNMKGLMTELASIEMDVTNIPGKKKPIYRLKFTANTLTSWDGYVKVRHAYQTYVDVATLKPLIMAQDSDVKGHITKAKYTFKHNTGKAVVKGTKTDGPAINKSIKLKANSFDVVSLIYLTRAIEYNKLRPGQNIPLDMIVLERSLGLNIKYFGKETIKVNKMGNKECYKIGLVLDRKFVVEPDVTFVWLTADENKVPVLISTIFKEGKALIKLSDYNGI